MKRIIFLGLVLALALFGSPVSADGMPPPPHAFYGSVSINGEPAPIDTTVEAKCEGVAAGVIGNPVTVTMEGEYGSADPLQQRLIVNGFIEDDTEITFYVDDVAAEPTYPFKSGATTELDLSVEIPEPTPEPTPPPGPVGGGGPSYYDVDTDFCGISGDFDIDRTGKVIKTQKVGCEGGPLTVTIEKGTIALDEDGKRLKTLTINEQKSPPDSPEGKNIIGIPYEFGPAGATFDPALTFTWTYDPADLPEGVAEEDLVLAYYDEDAGEWVILECVVDTEANTVTAKVSHFTIYALIGKVVVPPPKETPPVPTPPKPTPEPTPPAPTTPAPTTPAPTPPTPTPEAGFNWLYVIIPVVVVFGLFMWLGYYVRRRRRGY